MLSCLQRFDSVVFDCCHVLVCVSFYIQEIGAVKRMFYNNECFMRHGNNIFNFCCWVFAVCLVCRQSLRNPGGGDSIASLQGLVLVLVGP